MLTNVTTTIAGNLVEDPELRFTPSGAAVVKFRVASTPRYLDKQTNEWKDGEATFLTVNQWRGPAQNVADSIKKGDRVVVVGHLQQRSYETKEGEKRTVFEIQADEVAVSLNHASAKITKTSRSTPPSTDAADPNDDPWVTEQTA